MYKQYCAWNFLLIKVPVHSCYSVFCCYASYSTVVDFTGELPSDFRSILTKIKSGYLNGVRVQLGGLEDFISTSCILSIDWLINVNDSKSAVSTAYTVLSSRYHHSIQCASELISSILFQRKCQVCTASALMFPFRCWLCFVSCVCTSFVRPSALSSVSDFADRVVALPIWTERRITSK